MEARVVLLPADEVQEFRELCLEWEGRSRELPEALRVEMRAVAALAPNQLAGVQQIGPVVEVVLTPRVRALVANLRAQARGAAYRGLQR